MKPLPIMSSVSQGLGRPFLPSLNPLWGKFARLRTVTRSSVSQTSAAADCGGFHSRFFSGNPKERCKFSRSHTVVVDPRIGLADIDNNL